MRTLGLVMMTRFAVVLGSALASVGCGQSSTAPRALVADSVGAPRERAVYSTVPPAPDPDSHWLIYLHGAIIERGDRRPTHPRFGIYEYDQILAALADRGFEVVSEQRPAGQAATDAADRTVAQVDRLLAAGVPADHIGIVGFSKGGALAMMVADRLARDDIAFVFMATCGDWGPKTPPVVLRGRLLSIREASDELTTTCEPVAARAAAGTVSRELVVEIGGGHGAFYRPDERWLEPLSSWLVGDDTGASVAPPT